MISLTDTNTDMRIPIPIYRYQNRLDKIIKNHISIGIGIGIYKIQISVSVLIKVSKPLLKNRSFFVTKVSISFQFSYLWAYNYVFTQSRLFLILIKGNLIKIDCIGISI